MLVKNVSELALAMATEIKKEYLSDGFIDFSEFKEVTDFRTSDMKDRLYNVCHYDVKGAFLDECDYSVQFLDENYNVVGYASYREVSREVRRVLK